jgi:hypothetical protein
MKGTPMNPIDELATIHSKGRRMPGIYSDPDTEGEQIFDRPSRPCPGCGHVTGEGEVITKLFRTWWHQDCAQTYLRTEGTDEAWLVLGRQLADRPNAFKTAQTRAITEQLLRIATARVEPTRSATAVRLLG